MEKQATSGGGGAEGELDWGDDSGREEEGRVIDTLEAKWMKMNDTVRNLSYLCPSAPIIKPDLTH